MKKNKKLFAILTLVAFMITLMPVMAFAANEGLATPTYKANGDMELVVAGDAVAGYDAYVSASTLTTNDTIKLDTPAGTTTALDKAVKAGGKVTVPQVNVLANSTVVLVAKDGNGATQAILAVYKIAQDDVDASAQIVVVTDLKAKWDAYKASPATAVIDTFTGAYKAASTMDGDAFKKAAGLTAAEVDAVIYAKDAAGAYDALVVSQTDKTLKTFKDAYAKTSSAVFAQYTTPDKAVTAGKLAVAKDQYEAATIIGGAGTLVNNAVTAWKNLYNTSNSTNWDAFQTAYAKLTDAANKAAFNTAVGNNADLARQVNSAATWGDALRLIDAAKGTGSGVNASTTASKIYSVDTTATVKTEELEFDVQLKDSNNKSTTTLGTNSLVIWAERTKDTVSDADTLRINGKNYVGAVVLDTVNNSDVTVNVAANISGKVTLKAALVDTSSLRGTNDVEKAAGVISDGKNYLAGSFTGEFQSDSTSVNTLSINKIVGNNFAVTSAPYGTSGNVKTVYEGATANSLDKYTVTMDLTNKDGEAVVGQKVTVSGNKTGIEFNKTELVSDSRGQIKFDVTSTKKGMQTNAFTVTVVAGSKSTDVNLGFKAATAVNIKTVKAPTTAVAVDSEVTFKVSALDVNNNKVGGAATDVFSKSDSVATLGDKDYSLNFDAAVDSNGDYVVKFTPSKVGEYTVKITLANGKYVKETITVKEQGKVVKMELNYDADTVNIGSTSGVPEVLEMDADGVQKSVDNALVKFAANGKGLADITSKGEVKVSNDDKYAGNKITVTAVDKVNGISATKELTIAADAEGIAFASNNAQVGIDNAIQFSIVDANGNKVALGTNVEIDEANAVVISKPDGANATAVINKENELKDKGVALLTVASNKEGAVKVQVMIKTHYVDANDNNKIINKFYTGVADINVGKEPVKASDVVTMFIGSNSFLVGGTNETMDSAPFIKDGRTFVPIRAFGEATGATVNFDEKTQTITVVKAGKTLTMVIGSNVITSSTGETITSDVAPFIADGNRTVLPLRAVAEAFGYNVEAIAAADGSTAGVIFSVK